MTKALLLHTNEIKDFLTVRDIVVTSNKSYMLYDNYDNSVGYFSTCTYVSYIKVDPQVCYFYMATNGDMYLWLAIVPHKLDIDIQKTNLLGRTCCTAEVSDQNDPFMKYIWHNIFL